MELVTEHNLRVGGRVVEDDETDVGTIVECSDPHNVDVKFDSGARGVYCLKSDCNEYDGSQPNLYYVCYEPNN